MEKRLITIDYNEYIKLVENAEMKKEEMRKKIIEGVNKYEKQREESDRILRNHLLNEILLRCSLYTNSFGYIKEKNIAKYIIEKMHQ